MTVTPTGAIYYLHKVPEIEVLEDGAQFAALEDEWLELYSASVTATPFQSWQWLYSWWECYGNEYGLRLVTLRDPDSGVLVALLPLMLERRRRFGRLLFVGTGLTDYLDVLVRDGWQGPAAEASVRALQQMGSWQTADLQELRPEAAAWETFAGWPAGVSGVWQSGCPVISVGDWEDLLASMSVKARSNVRRSLRRAEQDELVRWTVPSGESVRAAHRFLELHREMWQGREIAPEHASLRFERCIEALIRRGSDEDLVRLEEFWHAGEVVASQIIFLGKDRIAGYLYGASEEFMSRYQVSSIFHWSIFNLARDRGILLLDLLRGEEGYKLRWTPEVRYNARLILGRNRGYGNAYAGYRASRYAVRRYLDSGSAPEWARRLLSPLRGR